MTSESSSPSPDSTTTATTPTIQTPSSAPPTAVSSPGKKKGPRRIIRRNKKNGGSGGANNDQGNSSIVDPTLLEKVLKESNLPYQVYSFEIVKTVEKIVSLNAHHVALQMPEGLLMYSTVLSDVFQRLVAAARPPMAQNTKDEQTSSSSSQSTPPLLQLSILGDVTYGACCVDDLGAQALGCDLLVHYGHSCLVPIQHTAIPCLYVFVEITIDVPHAVQCLHLTIQQQQRAQQDEEDVEKHPLPQIYLMGTIQFRPALMEARRLLKSDEYGYTDVTIPQAKPLSPGEVLGCTSPVLTDKNESDGECCDNGICTSGSSGDNKSSCSSDGCQDNSHNTQISKNKNNSVVLFIADGRFHLESTMISNPHIPHFYRYDPYGKNLTEEKYDHIEMKKIRYQAIETARSATTFGVILGTLGRQGNPAILRKVQQQIRQAGKRCFVMLCSEITPAKLALFTQKTARGTKIDAWVQIACPRLSVDWGHFLSQDGAIPVLSPYELFVCLEATPWREKYPMDFYSQQGGPWSNYHPDTKQRSITNNPIS